MSLQAASAKDVIAFCPLEELAIFLKSAMVPSLGQQILLAFYTSQMESIKLKGLHQKSMHATEWYAYSFIKGLLMSKEITEMFTCLLVLTNRTKIFFYSISS